MTLMKSILPKKSGPDRGIRGRAPRFPNLQFGIRESTCTAPNLSLWLVILTVGASLLAGSLIAQGAEKYNARLAPAPALGLRGGASAVAGLGSATASFSGRKLTVTGSFDKMASPATTAKLGLGLITGARGDFIFDIAVTKAPQGNPAGTSGTIAGSFDLTPAQVDALKQGKLYIQINSEGAPNGHLLGWLLK